MSYLLNSATNISLRTKKLRSDEIEIYDPITEEFVPVVPGGGGSDTEVPSYVQPTLIDFGDKRMKINQSHLEVGDVGSAMRKTEVKASGLDVTDDAGNNAKIEGGAIYYKKTSLEGEDENPTVTMAYEDIGEVVDKIKPIEYLKNDKIEFEPSDDYFRVFDVMGPTKRSTINSSYFGVYANKAATSTNYSIQTYDALTINGSLGASNSTAYQNGTIRKALSGVIRTLDLIDIMDSQTNYLKSDKIEFADGSGLSSAGLSYKIGDVVNTKTIREIAEMAQPYLREMGIDFRPLGDNDSIHITNINDSTVNTKTLALATPYTDPEYENAYHQTMIDALQFKYSDPETGLIYADNKDIINVTNKFKNVTGTVGNINAVISKFATSATSSLTATAINSMLNKLNGINSTAAQIDAAVANSGGTTYPYLKTNAIEFTDLGWSDTPLKMLRPSGRGTTFYPDEIEITSGAENNITGLRLLPGRIEFRQEGNNRTFTIDETGFMELTGSGGQYDIAHFDDLSHIAFKLSGIKATASDIDKAAGPGYYYVSNWANRQTAQTFWIYKLVPNAVSTYPFPLANIMRFKQAAVSGRKEFCFRMQYELSSPLSEGAEFKITFRCDKGPSVDTYKRAALFDAHTPGGMFEVLSMSESTEGDDVYNTPGDIWSGYVSPSADFLYYTIKCKAVRDLSATTIIFNLYLKFHGYIGDYVAMDSSLIGN